MGFIIRVFIWDIPILIFAYVLFSGPINSMLTLSTPKHKDLGFRTPNPKPTTLNPKPITLDPMPQAVNISYSRCKVILECNIPHHKHPILLTRPPVLRLQL